MKLGPVQRLVRGRGAGDAPTPPTHSGHVEGKGTDKRGGSRSKLVLDYRLAEVPGGTKVDIDADVQLVGPIAQFGRTGIVNETANVLIRQFVQNVEAKLAAMPSAATSATATIVTAGASSAASASSSASASSAPAPASAPVNQISAFRLLGAVIASWFRRVFGGG